MARTTVPTKELREWEKRFRPGYELGPHDGAGHWQIVGPDREVVRYTNGKPVTLASTPKSGGPHYQKRITQLLESAGVIGNGEVRQRPRHRLTPEQRARQRERTEATLAPRRANRQAEANELYGRLAPIVERLGGWQVEGLQADISLVSERLAAGRLATHMLEASLHRVRNKAWVTPEYRQVWDRFIAEMDRDDVVEHFYTLVREARHLPTSPVTPAKVASFASDEWPFVVQLVPLSTLMVDHRYQRPVHWPFVRRLAASFDERLVGAIDCAQRRGETLAIMDGQLRYEAMRLREKTTCWVAVYPTMGLEAEARFFLHKNRDRKMIHPFYIYRAELTSGEKTAVAIDRIMKGSRYELSSASGAGKHPEKIAAVAAVREVYGRAGLETSTIYQRSECLTPTLYWLGKTMYGKPGGTNSVLIRGLARFLAAYPDDELDLISLEQKLAALLPEYLLSRSTVGLQGSSGKSQALAIVLAEEYNERMPKEKRLNVSRLRA